MAEGLQTGTWIVVADGTKALFLVNEGDEHAAHFRVMRKEEQENPQAQDWAANRPGRFNDGPNVHRSAVEDTDWHELEQERFAGELADILYKRAHQGRFEKLVIAAAPQALGQIRKELHQEVVSRVIAEIDKDLTNHPIGEIEDLIAREIA